MGEGWRGRGLENTEPGGEAIWGSMINSDKFRVLRAFRGQWPTSAGHVAGHGALQVDPMCREHAGWR